MIFFRDTGETTVNFADSVFEPQTIAGSLVYSARKLPLIDNRFQMYDFFAYHFGKNELFASDVMVAVLNHMGTRIGSRYSLCSFPDGEREIYTVQIQDTFKIVGSDDLYSQTYSGMHFNATYQVEASREDVPTVVRTTSSTPEVEPKRSVSQVFSGIYTKARSINWPVTKTQSTEQKRHRGFASLIGGGDPDVVDLTRNRRK